jgi:hypothetical protein
LDYLSVLVVRRIYVAVLTQQKTICGHSIAQNTKRVCRLTCSSASSYLTASRSASPCISRAVPSEVGKISSRSLDRPKVKLTRRLGSTHSLDSFLMTRHFRTASPSHKSIIMIVHILSACAAICDHYIYRASDSTPFQLLNT